jgi:hypothetical protein
MARYRRFDHLATGSTATKPPLPELDDVRLRRAGLKAVMSGLELALATPVAQRDAWLSRVTDALNAVHEVWTRHIVETEAPGAFLDELTAESPRLSKPTSRLRREHNDVLAQITRAEKQLSMAPTGDDYDRWAEELRAELTSLLCALARHRQRGADLIYEAFDVDIGGGF